MRDELADWLADIFGMLGGLFGGGGGGGFFSSLFGSGGYQLSRLSPGLAMPPMPAFADGTDYVPRDMLAFIHEGERITPKGFNPAAGGKGGLVQHNTFMVPANVTRSTHARTAWRSGQPSMAASSRGTAG
jgi:hypothetical protein